MNLEDSEIYTVTIVRNIGTPISFTVRRWKFIFLTLIALIVIGGLLYGSVNYMLLRSETGSISEKLAETQKKLDVISKQMAEVDQKRYWVSKENKETEQAEVKDNLLSQRDFSTEGIWVAGKSDLYMDQMQSGKAISIQKFSASVSGDDLRIRVSLKNTSSPSEPAGGYMIVTLINRDQLPVVYKAATGGTVGKEGFPATYKSGRIYSLKRKGKVRSYNVKYKLTEADEYYTDATVFIFSFKGSLLTKKSIPLDKKIFLE